MASAPDLPPAETIEPLADAPPTVGPAIHVDPAPFSDARKLSPAFRQIARALFRTLLSHARITMQMERMHISTRVNHAIARTRGMIQHQVFGAEVIHRHMSHCVNNGGGDWGEESECVVGCGTDGMIAGAEVGRLPAGVAAGGGGGAVGGGVAGEGDEGFGGDQGEAEKRGVEVDVCVGDERDGVWGEGVGVVEQGVVRERAVGRVERQFGYVREGVEEGGQGGVGLAQQMVVGDWGVQVA